MEGDYLPKTKAEKWPVETYSRVVGYLSPISEWNKGKKEEYEDRQDYDMPRGVGKYEKNSY